MGGSPLEARSLSFLYVFAIAIIVCVALAALVSLIIYRIIAKTHTREWLEAQKNRETKLKDVEYVAREADLTSQEKTRLWHICRRYKARNIRFLYRSVNELNSMFHEEFERITQKQTRNEEKIGIFFSLRFKLENAHNRKLMVSSTRGIKKDQVITLYDSKNAPWSVKVLKTDDSGFYVMIPQELEVLEEKPKALDKIRISFTFPSGQAFNAISRAVRYERLPNTNQEVLFVSNSNHIKPVARRGAKRMAVDEKCSFSAIKNIGTESKPVLEVQKKKYPGILKDISATGCKIFCGLPITKGQMLDIIFRIPGIENEYEVQGQIVATKVLPDKKVYVLHIKFISIEQNVKNDIYSVIYGYF